MKIYSGSDGMTLNALRLQKFEFSKITERLSSGLRINSAADDPANNAISNNWKARIRGLNVAVNNVQDSISMLQTADGALAEITDIMMRGRELAVRAANDATLTTGDIQKMQDEVDALLDEIDRLAETVTFNGKKLLDGGDGTLTELTTQADWAAGTYNADEIDLDSSSGDVQLSVIPWDQDPQYNNPVQDNNNDNFGMYIKNAVDNGDGTYTAEFVLRGESVGAGGNQFCGYLSFDDTATFSNFSAGLSATGNPGEVFFDRSMGGTMNDLGSFKVTAPADSGWELRLTRRNGEQVNVYWGDEWLGNTRPAAIYTGFFSDITSSAEYETQAIDTGAVSGGTATMSYSADTPGGTNINVILYESADGSTWSPLAVVGNGDTFEFNQRYIKGVFTLTSSGIQYGSPILKDFSIQMYEDAIIQMGPENEEFNREYISPWNAHTAALGIDDLSLSSLTNAMLSMDSYTEWLAGTSNLNNIDLLSEPGSANLDIDIQTTGSPDKAGESAIVLSVDSAVANADGTYDFVMSVRFWGRDPAGDDDAVQWLANFGVTDGNGTVLIDEITCQSCEAQTNNSTSGDFLAGATPTPPVDTNDYRDGVWGIDAAGDYQGVKRTDGQLAGTFTGVYCDMATGGQMDGFSVRFTANPDAVFNLSFDHLGLENGGAGRVSTGAYAADVYFGDTQIADDIGAAAGATAISYRLGEYVNSGTFETSPVLVGYDTESSISGLSNSGNQLVTVEISPDGLGSWEQVIAPGTGVTTFSTTADKPYARAVVELSSTAATVNLTPGTYDYTPSSAPTLTSMSINADVSPIEQFDAAIEEVCEIRGDIGTLINKLNYAIDEMKQEAINIAAANSAIEDTDFASALTELGRTNILSEMSTNALGDYRQTREAIVDFIRNSFELQNFT